MDPNYNRSAPQQVELNDDDRSNTATADDEEVFEVTVPSNLIDPSQSRPNGHMMESRPTRAIPFPVHLSSVRPISLVDVSMQKPPMMQAFPGLHGALLSSRMEYQQGSGISETGLVRPSGLTQGSRREGLLAVIQNALDLLEDDNLIDDVEEWMNN